MHCSAQPQHLSLRTDPAFSLCPQSHPFAYKDGALCCSSSLEMTSGADWKISGSRGMLQFSSLTCGGQSVECERQPCLNYNYNKYNNTLVSYNKLYCYYNKYNNTLVSLNTII